jgi:hypothetical protein
VPVANLVVETTNNETNLSSIVSALTNDTTNTTAAASAPQTTTATDIEIAQEVYSGTFMPPAASKSDLDGNSERAATKTNDTHETSAPRNAPYCSRLFYTLLCLALLVLIIVFIVLGITILKDGGPKPERDRLPPQPPPPPRLPPPPPTLSPVVGATSTNNDTDSTNTTTDST